MKIIKDILKYSLPNFLTGVVNLAMLPILTRVLTPGDYGVLALAWSIPSILVAVVSLGIMASPSRYYFKWKSDREKLLLYIFSSQLFLYLSLFISTIVVYLSKDYISLFLFKSDLYGDAIAYAFMAGYLNQIFSYYLLLLKCENVVNQHCILRIIYLVFVTLGNVIFVILMKLSFMGMIFSSYLANLIVVIAALLLINKRRKIKFRFDLLFSAISYGVQIIPKTFTGFVNRFFDKYMLNNMVSLSVTGLYNVGQSIGNYLSILLTSVNSAYYSKYSELVFKKGEKASKEVGKMFTKILFLSAIPTVSLMLFSKEFVQILLPSNYQGAISVIILVALAIAFSIVGKFVGVQFAYTKKLYMIFPITVVGVLVNIIGNIVLIPKFSLLGAGSSLVLSSMVTNMLLFIVGQRLYHISYEYFKVIFIYLFILISSITLILIYELQMSLSIEYFVKFGLVCCFLGGGFVLGIVNRENIVQIFKILKLEKIYGRKVYTS